ncbi:hypothetical protein DFH08DRAFT_817336 [Mycena albidolilacea]|uniref:Uncharacterized protein n=1 Tax=Mycena albidolilacea TaxID=1033008 RepID=A0AAD6ZIL7_9AGAR|nr:hypothetical protein DFH08DRAFT_817336 [Mycena albidolilacea]
MPRALHPDCTGWGVNEKRDVLFHLLALPRELPSHCAATVFSTWFPISCFWKCADRIEASGGARRRRSSSVTNRMTTGESIPLSIPPLRRSVAKAYLVGVFNIAKKTAQSIKLWRSWKSLKYRPI